MGKGFTEWRSVASARPYFRGHHQPHIPADLGFYDLRFEETRIVQAQLAREYLLSGFCYYHYWFNGKLLLERPLNEVLKSGRPDFPFCLCWANENWTRAWDGREREILISQRYDLASAGDHVRWLTRAFLDRRYIRIGDRPLILIYRTDILSDPKRVLEIWREVARREGIPDLYITAVRSNFAQVSEPELISIGFDAVVEFQPFVQDIPPLSLAQGCSIFIKRCCKKLLALIGLEQAAGSLRICMRYSYAQLVRRAMSREHPKSHIRFPCVTPGWDNSARRREPTVIQNDDDALYGTWLRSAVRRVRDYSADEQIVFINAWNEWAEGCHLEPDLRNGRRFLEATRRALIGTPPDS